MCNVHTATVIITHEENLDTHIAWNASVQHLITPIAHFFRSEQILSI